MNFSKLDNTCWSTFWTKGRIQAFTSKAARTTGEYWQTVPIVSSIWRLLTEYQTGITCCIRKQLHSRHNLDDRPWSRPH